MSNGFIMVGVLSGGYALFSVGCLTWIGVRGKQSHRQIVIDLGKCLFMTRNFDIFKWNDVHLYVFIKQ